MYKKKQFKFYQGDIPPLDKEFVKWLFEHRQNELYGGHKFDDYMQIYRNIYRRYKRERDYEFVTTILGELDNYNKDIAND